MDTRGVHKIFNGHPSSELNIHILLHNLELHHTKLSLPSCYFIIKTLISIGNILH